METHTQTKVLPGAVLAAGLMMGAGSALSAAVTGNFTTTASIGPSCVVSDGRLDFGQYSSVDNATAPLDAQSVGVTVTCTMGTEYQVYSTTATKELPKSGGGTPLAFQLYSDAGRSTPLPTSNVAGAIAGVGDSTTQTITLYGRIPPGQNPEAGHYSLMTNLTVFY